MLNIIRNLNRNVFVLNNLVRKANYVTENSSELLKKDSSQEVTSAQELDDLYKKVIVEVRGHDPKVLESYEQFVKMTAQELELNLKCIRTPFRFIERWTILKSRFSNRKHMRQYEMRTHFKEFEFVHLTGSTCSTLLEYIQRNLPEGVAMHVHQTKLAELPEDFKNA